MSLVNLLQRQVESRAEMLCDNRNRSMPTELGKSSYASIEGGVEFIKLHYLLDSSHCDYSSLVAKVQWDSNTECWHLFMTDDDGSTVDWIPYPYLIQSRDLTAIMREIDKDPKSIFWQ